MNKKFMTSLFLLSTVCVVNAMDIMKALLVGKREEVYMYYNEKTKLIMGAILSDPYCIVMEKEAGKLDFPFVRVLPEGINFKDDQISDRIFYSLMLAINAEEARLEKKAGLHGIMPDSTKALKKSTIKNIINIFFNF